MSGKNIFLCGFMGCGKSTVGRALASQLGMDFIDMDAYIEETAKESVQEIFKNHGEARFRTLEHDAALALAALDGCVVGTGGGAVLSQDNVKAMKRGGLIVLIDVPLPIIARRLEGDTTRPLLQQPDKSAAMRALYEARMPVYRAAADITVENPDDRPEALVARDIALALSQG
jgi:shikimate kinase